MFQLPLKRKNDMDTPQQFDFHRDVIERSHDIPVLVDFWADWCAPCRMLTPILENVAIKNSNRWQLVKINTEEYPDFATTYKVKSIPNVKLFYNGEVLTEFTGVLTEYQFEAWLKKEVPSRYEKEIAHAVKCMADGNPTMALSLLDGVLHKEPDNLKAMAHLIKLKLFSKPEEVVHLATFLESEKEYGELAETVKCFVRLFALDRESMPDDDVRDNYMTAVEQLRHEQFDEALDGFINVLRRNRYYDDDGSRKVCIAIFRFLGEENDITRKYRRSFDRAF